MHASSVRVCMMMNASSNLYGASAQLYFTPSSSEIARIYLCVVEGARQKILITVISNLTFVRGRRTKVKVYFFDISAISEPILLK